MSDSPTSSEPTALPAQLLHDLRTPVHQIVGYVEMLQEDAADAENAELSTDLGKVRESAALLQAMLDERFTPVRNEAEVETEPEAAPVAPASKPAVPVVPAPAAEDDQSLSSGAERGLLLVVDDNETNRDVLSRRLKMQGYAVETAESGVDALGAVEARVFDLVLLDIMMPDMDGYEVLRRLKESDKTRDLPVIMISAIGDLDSVVRCVEMGAEDYLPKPFNPTLLKARIGACLEKKRGHDREMRLFSQLQDNYSKLQEMEKIRDDLTHMIVHDLRTPLSSLMAGLQTMELLGPLSSDQAECCDIALRGGQSLLGMINDLLDISKLEDGAPNLDLETLSVADLFEQSREQVQSAATHRDVTLEREFAPDLPDFQGDMSKLQRTFVNLLGNAIKFSPTDSRIVTGARVQENSEADKSELLLWVRDYGEGIPRDAFERIFEKFGQVEARKAGRAMSTGLGLALCKMVVEAHRGRIWVESELGQGSTFYLTLPLAN